ncbi:hypothetical protein HNO89_003516 [Sporosarcina luteola]|nr:hypothetical protein [Sporosarcina luteola]
MKKSPNAYERFPQDQVRSAIRSGIVQAQEQSPAPILRQRKWKSKATYALSSAAIVFGLLVGSSYYSPAWAHSLSQIPLIGSIFANSNLIGLQRAQKLGLTNKIGETQTINSIAVTLDEILYDQNNITIGLYMESDKELDELYFGSGMQFTINGNYPYSSSVTYGEQILSPTSRTAILEIDVTDSMPETFEIGLILSGKNEENWYFSAPVKKITDIQTIPIQHVQDVDGLRLAVRDLSYSETGVNITFESSEEVTDIDQHRGAFVDFQLIDQDGNEIAGHSTGGQSELVKHRIFFKSKKHFDPFDSDVTELTLIPYLVIPSGGERVEIEENGKKQQVKLNWDSIQPIDFESIKIKIPR